MVYVFTELTYHHVLYYVIHDLTPYPECKTIDCRQNHIRQKVPKHDLLPLRLHKVLLHPSSEDCSKSSSLPQLWRNVFGNDESLLTLIKREQCIVCIKGEHFFHRYFFIRAICYNNFDKSWRAHTIYSAR